MRQKSLQRLNSLEENKHNNNNNGLPTLSTTPINVPTFQKASQNSSEDSQEEFRELERQIKERENLLHLKKERKLIQQQIDMASAIAKDAYKSLEVLKDQQVKSIVDENQLILNINKRDSAKHKAALSTNFLSENNNFAGQPTTVEKSLLPNFNILQNPSSVSGLGNELGLGLLSKKSSVVGMGRNVAANQSQISTSSSLQKSDQEILMETLVFLGFLKEWKPKNPPN